MRGFRVIVVVFLFLLSSSEARNATVLADGLSWLENLCFGGQKGLFFSEAIRARVWHIAAPGENYTLYLDLNKVAPMKRILGVAFHFG